MKSAVGLRGVGLFLLVFLPAVTTGREYSDRAAKITMLAVNGLVVALGLVNLTGPLWLRRETRWLREYLQRGQRVDPGRAPSANA